MAIMSCFFCVPTPNTSISDSNLQWSQLASSPRLSSFSSSFTGVISVKSISFHRCVSIFPFLSASIDNGDSDYNGGGLGGGGSGDGSKNIGDGDGDGDEDRDRNRDEAMLLLAESGTGLETLPKDLAAAIESGRIPGSPGASEIGCDAVADAVFWL